MTIRAENTTTEHNRTIRFTGLPQKYQDDPAELLVTINYVDANSGSRVQRAIALDNVVIPAILRAINGL